MIYCCENCGFLFQRAGEVQTCHSCEGYRLRPATHEESETLQFLLKTIEKAVEENMEEKTI